MCFCNVLGLLLSTFPTPELLSDLHLSVDSQVLSCNGVFWCMLPLWSVQTFHVGMSGENKLRYLVHFSARSKYCNPQNKRLVLLLFYSTLECHTLSYPNVLLSLMTYLMKWCSYLPYPSTSELLGLEIVEDAYWGGNRIFLAIVIVLKSKDFDRNLACVLELDAVVNSWDSVPLVNCCNSSLGHVKSEISARLPKSESQAEMMVGVLKSMT